MKRAEKNGEDFYKSEEIVTKFQGDDLENLKKIFESLNQQNYFSKQKEELEQRFEITNNENQKIKNQNKGLNLYLIIYLSKSF